MVAAALSALVYQWQTNRGTEAPAAAIQADKSFDFYLMAYTLHPAFCEDGNARKPDCQRLTAADNSRRPLVVHGLWPENRRPGAYPRDCPGPKLTLSRALRAELDQWMPGTASGLHTHEWRKHGKCSGLDAAQYFRVSIDLARGLNDTIGSTILASTERQITGEQLRAAANARQPSLGDTLTFHRRNVRSADPAKRGRPYLIEIRQCIDNDAVGGAPGTLLACRSVERRDQGCGARFWIDGV